MICIRFPAQRRRSSNTIIHFRCLRQTVRFNQSISSEGVHKLNKPFRKILSTAIALLVMIMSFAMPVSAANFDDMGKHWSEPAVSKWSEYGVISGYAGAFRPDEPVTRAEFSTMINNVMKYVEKGENKFSDLQPDQWYYDAMIKLNKAGVMDGAGGKAMPDNKITRQEAAVLVARAFKIGSAASASAFTDEATIADWAKGAVRALASKKAINGMPDGTFRPLSNLTRAEAVTLFDHFIQSLISKPSVYSKDVIGNVVVNSPDVILKDMKISGDLYIAQGVGEGEVTLNNVEIAGTVHVYGGGEHSIIFNNVDVKGALVVNRYEGKVRILATGSTSVSVTILESGAMLVTKELTGGGFETVEISSEVLAGQSIVLDGNFNKVVNHSDSAQITANGKINELVAEANTNINGNVSVGKTTTADGTNATVNNNAIRPAGESGTPAGGSPSGGSTGGSPTGGAGGNPSGGGNDDGGSIGGGGGGGTPAIAVSGISIHEKDVVLVVGETKQLTATIAPSNADNKNVTWKVEDGSTDVVTVGQNGLLTAIAAGTKRIQVITSDGGKTDQISVTVSKPAFAIALAKFDGPAVDPSAAIDEAVKTNSMNLTIGGVVKSVYQNNQYEALITAQRALQKTKDPTGNYAYVVITLKDRAGNPIADTTGINVSVTGTTYEPVFGKELAEGYRSGSFVLKMDAGEADSVKRFSLTFSHKNYADTILSLSYTPKGAAFITGIEPITGDAKIGSKLTAGKVEYAGTPANQNVSYKWSRADNEKGPYTEISGASAPVYELTEADSGKYIRVEASADQVHVGGSAVSVPFGPVEKLVKASDVFAAIEAMFLAGNKDLNNVISNVYLPVSLPAFPGIAISWSSDNAAVISTAGVVTRHDRDDRFVTLTATLTGQVTGSKSYQAIVRTKGTDRVDIVDYVDKYFAEGYPQVFVKNGTIWVRYKLKAPAEVFMVINASNGHLESDVRAVLEGHAGKNGIVSVNDWPYFKADHSQVDQIQEFDTGVSLAANRPARVEFAIRDNTSNYTSSAVTTVLFDQATVGALDTSAPIASGMFVNQALNAVYVYFNEPLDTASTPKLSDFTLNYGDVKGIVLYNYQAVSGIASSYVKLTVDGIPSQYKSQLKLSYNGSAIQDTADARNKVQPFTSRAVTSILDRIDIVTVSSDRMSMIVELRPGWNPLDNAGASNAAPRFTVTVDGGQYSPLLASTGYNTSYMRFKFKFNAPLPVGNLTVRADTSGIKNWAMDLYPNELLSQNAKEIPAPGIPSAAYTQSDGKLKLTFADQFEFDATTFNASGLVLKVDNAEYMPRGFIVRRDPSKTNTLVIDLKDKYSWPFKNAVETGTAIQIKYSKVNGNDSRQLSDSAGALVPEFDYVTVNKLP